MNKKTERKAIKYAQEQEPEYEIDVEKLVPIKTYAYTRHSLSGDFIVLEKDKKADTNIIAFWRPTDPYGWLGQWHESEFEAPPELIRFGGKTKYENHLQKLGIYNDRRDVLMSLIKQKIFNTAEKFMMMGKAAVFEDNKIFEIMTKTQSPKELKALGQCVKNFDEDTWKYYCQDIVKIGNYLKFSQNPELKKKLLETNSAILVEGSPMDKIWGVGLKFDDPKIKNKTEWRGTNYLGECLMYVREILKTEK